MLDRGFGAAGGWGRKGAEGTIVRERGDGVVVMADYGAEARRREARMPGCLLTKLRDVIGKVLREGGGVKMLE